MASAGVPWNETVEGMADGVIVRDPKLVVLACNAASERLLGLSIDQLNGVAPLDPEWSAVDEGGSPLPRAHDGLPVVLRERTARSMLLGIHKPDGIATWLLMSCVPVLESGARGLMAFVSTFTDITAFKEQADELRRSERRARSILEATHEGVWVLHRDGSTSHANPRMAELLGCTSEVLASSSIWEFLEQEDHACVEELLDGRSRHTGELCDFRLRRADGSFIWASIAMAPMASSDGEKNAVLATVRDVTTARRIEADVRASKEHLETALIAGQMGTWEVDVATGEMVISQALRQIHGLADDSVLDTLDAYFAYIHPDDRDQLRDHRRDYLASGGTARGVLDYRIVRPDGEVRWVRTCGQALTLVDGSKRLIGATVDITDNRAMQEQLEQVRQLEAIGRLAGGVAHDFNNLTTAILAALSYVEAAKVDKIRDDVATIRTAAERGAELTRQLLAFARKQVVELTSIDLSAIVLELMSVLSRLLGEDIALTIDLQPEMWLMRGGEGQLEQVVINLVINGREAMPAGGTLKIETRNVTIGDSTLHEHRGIPAGDYVYLAVTDSGTGIDDSVLPHIFEPFYTTRRTGTGLGLASTYGIVRQLGGYIRVRTEPEAGSTFLVYFPRQLDASRASEPTIERVEVVARPTATLMFVEDDDLVRRVISRGLADAGYQVLVASDAAQALEIASHHAGTIDVLIADVVMPGISGCQLAHKLATERPDTKVLYVSGYTNQVIARYGVLEPGQNFLAKPYTIDVLRDRVDELLYSE
jgi:PAS domain S-box-containing protein